jgi:ABC-type transporter Mla MlaB component
MYRGWKNSVYHRDVILPLWQCESKYQHQNTLKIDGKLSNDTPIALWIAAGVLRTFGF